MIKFIKVFCRNFLFGFFVFLLLFSHFEYQIFNRGLEMVKAQEDAQIGEEEILLEEESAPTQPDQNDNPKTEITAEQTSEEPVTEVSAQQTGEEPIATEIIGEQTGEEPMTSIIGIQTGEEPISPQPAPTPVIQRLVTTVREVERDRDTDSSSRSSATANARGGTTNITLAQNPQVHPTPTLTPIPTPTFTPTPTHKTFPVSRQTFISSPTTAPTFTQLQTSPPVTIIQSERLPVENQAQTVNVSQTQSQNQTQTQNNTQNVTNTNTATGGSSGSTEPTRVIVTSASTPTTTTYQQPAQMPAVEQKSVPVVTQSAPAADTKELPRTGLPLAGVGLASLIPVGLKLRRSGAPTTLPELSANSIWIERQLKV